ncbi:MAG TPA: exopolysaccharide biosynthesis protein, partial [Candidatus Paceibacterota bacterium]|nr:exopolysaccharide biosynthesis protein [Candidatus Paceibacterota bacterium]
QQKRFLGASIKVLHWLEKGVKPCAGSWLEWRVVRRINMVLLGSMGFLLALPVPMPFTNTIPAYAIVLLAVSLMEEDGRVVWVGYGLALGTYLYFGLMAGTLAALIHKYFNAWLP